MGFTASLMTCITLWCIYKHAFCVNPQMQQAQSEQFKLECVDTFQVVSMILTKYLLSPG